MQAPAYPIFDGHNDALLELLIPHDGAARSFFEENTGTHIDLPRSRRGGLAGGIFAMFVPPEDGRLKPDKDDLILTDKGYEVKPQPEVPQAYAETIASQMIDLAHRIVKKSDGEVGIARSSDELKNYIKNEKLAIVLHLEGAEAILPGLENLQDFYDRGLRSLGPVWSRANAFGHGVPFRYPSSPDTGPGLTEAGRKLVTACNQLGILIDLAHLNEKGFWEVADLTDKPLVVSHSAAHALTQSSRNVTDKQLDAIGESDGLIGLTFCVSDLHPTGSLDLDTPVSRLVEHILYITERIGIEHVAFGSDYDGATISKEIPDISSFPIIMEALRNAGFDNRALKLIAMDNWLRVLGKTWK